MIQLYVYIVVVLIIELFLTLHYPMDCSPSGSSVHGVFQARILEWVAIFFQGDLADLGIDPVSPALAGSFLSLSHHILFLYKFFSIMFYHRILNIALCPMQSTLLFIYSVYKTLHLLTNLPLHPSPSHLPLGNDQPVLYAWDSVSVS